MPIRVGVHHVRRGAAGMVLVEFLASLARSDPKASREANELVRSGRVQIDGNLCTDPARELKVGEVVKVLGHAAAPAARREDVRLVYADEDVVVIEKPPGVTTLREGGQGRRGQGQRNRQETLDQMVARLLAGVAAGGEAGSSRRAVKGARQSSRGGKRGSKRSGTGLPAADPWHGAPARHARSPDAEKSTGARHGGGARSDTRVFPVHRLDRDTSGLMVFARTPEAQRALEAQFKARDVERSYLAVVHGHPEAMTITTHIVRDRGDGLRGSAEVWGKDPAAGQRAVTHIEPLEKIGPYSVVRCRLETGRTHQIRIHLCEIGHMLCGEKEYVRRPDGTRMRDDSGAPRQALHAERLEFAHPASGREMSFNSRLAKDLARWLQMLGTRVRASRSQSRD